MRKERDDKDFCNISSGSEFRIFLRSNMYKHFCYASGVSDHINCGIVYLRFDAGRKGYVEIFYMFCAPDDNRSNDSKSAGQSDGDDDTVLYKIQLCDT